MGKPDTVGLRIKSHMFGFTVAGLAFDPEMGRMGCFLSVNGMAAATPGPALCFMRGPSHIPMTIQACNEFVGVFVKRPGVYPERNAPFINAFLARLFPVAFHAQCPGRKDPFIGVGVGSPVAIQTFSFFPVNKGGHHIRVLSPSGRAYKSTKDSKDNESRLLIQLLIIPFPVESRIRPLIRYLLLP